MNPSELSKRHLLLALLLLIVLCIPIGVDSAVMAQMVLGSPVGIISAIVGLGIAGIVLARRSTLHPFGAVALTVVGLGLYGLFRGVLMQLPTVVLPPYLPAFWIEAVCTAGIGILVGMGLPLLLSTLSAHLYGLLE